MVVMMMMMLLALLEHSVERFGHFLNAFMDSGRPGELKLILGRSPTAGAFATVSNNDYATIIGDS